MPWVKLVLDSLVLTPASAPPSTSPSTSSRALTWPCPFPVVVPTHHLMEPEDPVDVLLQAEVESWPLLTRRGSHQSKGAKS